MRWFGSGLIAALAIFGWTLVGSPSPAHATEALVLGDSIGEGLAKTVGLRHIAKRSFSLRRGDVSAQIAQLPAERVGLLSLGLNDASDPVAQLTKSIEKIIQVLIESQKKIVWLGPPCVLKKWDDRAAALDTHLKTRLAGTTIQYVSLRDEKICSQSLRTRDGEHFTFDGYRYVWEKVRRDASHAASVVPDTCELQRTTAMFKGQKPPQCTDIVASKK